MNDTDAIIELFEYDLWANTRWLEPASYAGLTLVLGHMAWAQELWLARCKGESQIAVQDVHPTREHLERLVQEWQSFLSETPLDVPITYESLNGQRFTDEVVGIVRHVLNHGTYHRGDMRGRCELLGKPFPETDYIWFLREKRAKS